LKNSLYGELRWEDEFDEKYWFARVENEIFGEHEVLIYVNSPTDFMAVSGTHSTYKNILADLEKIKSQSVRYIIENEEDLRFHKSRQTNFAIKKIEEGLQLYCVKICQDLSSEVIFDSEMFEETDEFIFTAI